MVRFVLIVILLGTSLVTPFVVHRMRHAPHRLEQGTQHIVWAGIGLQAFCFVLIFLVWWMFR